VRWLRGQIFVGSANGTVTALYSPASSVRGVKLCIARPAKRAEPADSLQYSPDMLVITPHALPLFRDTTVRNRDRRMEKLRKDAIMSHKPGARQALTASISLSLCLYQEETERERQREEGDAHTCSAMRRTTATRTQPSLDFTLISVRVNVYAYVYADACGHGHGWGCRHAHVGPWAWRSHWRRL
jgi:hypothetical protein